MRTTSPAFEADFVALADSGAFGPYCASPERIRHTADAVIVSSVAPAHYEIALSDLSSREQRASTSVAEPRLVHSVPMRSLGSLEDPPWSLFDLHTDHLGSVRAVTGNGGALLSRHDYFPFGEMIASQWSYNTHAFTGHERDESNGLDVMLKRYYSRSTSRFISADLTPAILPTSVASWNRFSYSRNSPITRWDPDGAADTPISSNEGLSSLWFQAVSYIVGINQGPYAPLERTFVRTGGVCDGGAPACTTGYIGEEQVVLAIDHPDMERLVRNQTKLNLVFFSMIVVHEGRHYFSLVGLDTRGVAKFAKNFIKSYEMDIAYLKDALGRDQSLTDGERKSVKEYIAGLEREIEKARKLVDAAAGQPSDFEAYWSYIPGPQGSEVPRGEGQAWHVRVYINGWPTD